MDEANPKKRAELQRQYNRGWFLGSTTAKKQLVRRLVKSHPQSVRSERDRREINEKKWNQYVRAELKRRKKSEQDILHDRKGAKWKVEITRSLRRHYTASNPWIARRLNMGHPTRVSMAARGKAS